MFQTVHNLSFFISKTIFYLEICIFRKIVNKNDVNVKIIQNCVSKRMGFFLEVITRRCRQDSKKIASKRIQIKQLRWRRSGPIPSQQNVYLPGLHRLQTRMSKIVNKVEHFNAQRIRVEGYSAEVNKRGDPCTLGRQGRHESKKYTELLESSPRSSNPCQRVVTMLKSILRRKPVPHPILLNTS